MYIRESDKDKDADKEGQLIDCRTIAVRDGANPDALILYDDWNRSGSEGSKRPAQDKLIKDIKDGRVSAVYARSLDRLMRSTVEMAAFFKLCEKMHTRIVTLREGEMREDNPSQWIARQSIMMAAEYESRVGKIRAASTVATKRRNGIPMGRLAYGEQDGEDIQPLIDAFTEAGSFLGACKLLNERGIKTRLGGDWNVKSLSRILRRQDFENIPRPARRGAAAGRATRIFSGLLVCHCGDVLTSMPRFWRDIHGVKHERSVGYYCRRAHSNTAHTRPYMITEPRLMPWARAEVTRGLGLLRPRFEEQNASAAERERLDARRARVIDAFLDGTIDKPTRDNELAKTDAAITRLGETTKSIRFVGITQTFDWTADPSVINANLHQLWRSVTLGNDLLPVTADWYVTPFDRETTLDPLERVIRGLPVGGEAEEA